MRCICFKIREESGKCSEWDGHREEGALKRLTFGHPRQFDYKTIRSLKPVSLSYTK